MVITDAMPCYGPAGTLIGSEPLDAPFTRASVFSHGSQTIVRLHIDSAHALDVVIPPDGAGVPITHTKSFPLVIETAIEAARSMRGL